MGDREQSAESATDGRAKVVDLMAALEESLVAAKDARRRDPRIAGVRMIRVYEVECLLCTRDGALLGYEADAKTAREVWLAHYESAHNAEVQA